MDQHPAALDVGVRQGGKPVADGFLAAGAAGDGRRQIEAGGCGVVQRPVVWVDHDAHAGDGGMADIGVDGVRQHRPSGKPAILLWHIGVGHARAAAGGDDQGMGAGHAGGTASSYRKRAG